MKYDYIIVGAGMSGLYTAYLLSKKYPKSTFLLLETSSIPGGRTHSIPTKSGKIIDVGGQWIGTPQKRIIKLIHFFNIPLISQYHDGKHIANFNGNIQVSSGNISENTSTTLEYTIVIDKLNQLATKYPDGEKTALDWLKNNIKNPRIAAMIEWLFKVCICEEAGNLSFYYWLYFLRNCGSYQAISDISNGAQEYRLGSGMIELYNNLFVEINGYKNVQFGNYVKKVEFSGNGYIIETNMRKYNCNDIIISAPPPAINKICFVPELPAEKCEIYRNMKMGSVIKMITVYPQPYWRNAGYSGEIISNQEPIYLAYDYSDEKRNFYALVSFICAADVPKYSQLSSEERKTIVASAFAKYFGIKELNNPIGFYEKNWSQDPYSNGCYFATPSVDIINNPEKAYQFGEILRKTVDNNGHYIYFVGTETAYEWMGYIEGALESAERCIDEISSPLLVKKGKIHSSIVTNYSKL